MSHYKSDFLVIGSGIAGLSFALKAAKHGSVHIINKGASSESNSAWAQGGVSSVLEPELRSDNDSTKLHLQDTINAGAGLCDEINAQHLIEQGEKCIENLIEWGVQFDKNSEGKYDLGQEGGHQKRRILHAKDSTGKIIIDALLQAARSHPNITFYASHCAIDLVQADKINPSLKPKILGAYVLEEATGEVHIFSSQRVILATGGCGKAYLYTTNPDSATGDGLAMASRAGASISNMEFIQFHPTCFYNPAAQAAPERSLLISEALRGEGAKIINSQGQDFVQAEHPLGALAPRDIVAQAIDKEIKRTGAACVYLDARSMTQPINERFPFIYETLLKYGINATKDLIPVVPAAHYQCGGITASVNGQSSLENLYALGECACTGLHGANRLASNSLLEGVAMAQLAIESMTQQKQELIEDSLFEQIQPWKHGNRTQADEKVIIYHNWDEIRRLMADYVSIVRTDNRLERALRRINNLKDEVKEFYWGNRIDRDVIELRNLIQVSELIIKSAMQRKESRGLHFTLSYPQTDDIKFKKPTYL